MLKPFSTKKYSNTNVDEVKRLNAQSGLSYNEVKQLLAAHLKKEQKWGLPRICSFLNFKAFI